MSTSERQKGIQVHRPIIYGSHARLLTDAEKALAPAGHTHRWTIFLTSATSPPPVKQANSTDPPSIDMDYLPGGADSLSYLLKKVTFKLHDTYPSPNRVLDKPPFQVTETGWGEFAVLIRLQFIPEANEKVLTLSHMIKLHHWGPPIEALASSSAAPAPSGSAPQPHAELGTPVPDEAKDAAGEAGEKKEAEEGEKKPEGEMVSGEGDIKAEVNTPNPTTADPQLQRQTSVTNDQSTSSHQPLSIAARVPVHSWQYDELVFSDPPQTFLTILNENPPTPLPAKNRRARDQREEHSLSAASKKSKKPRPSLPPAAGATASAPGTPAPTAGETPGGAAGAGQQVGIPGELGSADVPLEFSLEMERGEWNRLNDVRVKIVDEMDRWREKLIASEKELAKLKEELRG